MPETDSPIRRPGINRTRRRSKSATEFAGLVLAAAAAVGSFDAARAGSTLNIDAPTLNAVLPLAVPREVMVELATGTKLKVELDDLQVTGFDPAGGEGSDGHILTSVRVRIPQFGVDVPLTPRLALRVFDAGDGPMIELRFIRAEVALPLAGKINIATFVPPLRYPASNLFHLNGADGPIPMLGRVTGVTMGAKSLRVDFELERRRVSG